MLTEEPVHKEIIDTFFKKSASGKTPAETPRKAKKQIRLFIALAATTALAFFVIISILYIGKPVYRAGKNRTFHRLYSEDILRNGGINRANVEELYFKGDAKLKSSLSKSSIRLVNSVVSGDASLVLRLRKPLDLEGKNILLFARAEHGTKKIRLKLKDSENRIYALPAVRISSEWSLKYVPVVGARSAFGLSSVKEMEIEFGKHAAGNKDRSVIYVKNITVRGVL